MTGVSDSIFQTNIHLLFVIDIYVDEKNAV